MNSEYVMSSAWAPNLSFSSLPFHAERRQLLLQMVTHLEDAGRCEVPRRPAAEQAAARQTPSKAERNMCISERKIIDQ